MQEIVGNLVTHISSGVENEVDSALSVLEFLVENHGNQMASFVVFVKVRFYPLFAFLWSWKLYLDGSIIVLCHQYVNSVIAIVS